MERPAYLRDDLYGLILGRFNHLDDEEMLEALRASGYEFDAGLAREGGLAAVLDQPSRFLHRQCDVLRRPDLLTGLLIEFDDDELDAGLTYLIDAEAAAEIAADDETILLRSGVAAVLVPRSRIERAFEDGCSIDYLEL